MFHIFHTYILVITLSMPMGNNVHLDRQSTYTYTGYHSLQKCEQERKDAMSAKVSKDDKQVVSECKKQ